MSDYKPYARWTNDCQGKQDYDGRLISISTRYYPGPGGGGFLVFGDGQPMREVPYGDKPSAQASILLNHGPSEEGDGGGNYMVLASEEFSGETEAEVKAKVESWVALKMNWIVTALESLGMKAVEP